MIIAMTFGLVELSNAQKQSSGLYLTYNDYLSHKLSYTADANKLVLHEFIGISKITVISNGKKTTIPKSEIFGYRDSQGNDYRFSNNKSYQVIDTTAFYIYSYDKLTQQGKGLKPTKVYYFSKKTGDEILPLTSENIAKAFPKNPKFRYMVEVAAKADIKLDAYDNVSNEYKIKELYAESLR
jgi:hypothetical protein